MAPRPTTLFELFGDFTALWPVRTIAESVGDPQDTPEDPAAWLAALNAATRLTNIRTGAIDSRAAVEATVAFHNAQSGYPEGLPFVFRSMTDVEFRLLDTGANPPSKLFVGVDEAGGAEVLLEGVPVEIRLPVGLVSPHPGPPDHPSGITSETVGDFTAGQADDLEITYSNTEPTKIRVHVRLHMTANGEVSIRTPMPISFGPCLFSGIPCKAVHDFSLIPSPSIIPQTVDWIRTSELNPTDLGADDGAFGVRSIHLDMATAPLKGAADWLKGHADTELPAEVVIDDLVVPFFGVPRHFTAGIRRGIVDPKDPAQVFAFEKAPSVVFFTRDPSFGVILERFFARLPPVDDPKDNDDYTVEGVSLAASVFLGGKSSKDGGEDGALSPQTLELSLGENITPRLTYRRAFDPATGLPAGGEGAGNFVNAVFHHTIADSSIDVMAMRLGFSVGKITDGESSWQDSLEATIDLFISVPPTGEDKSLFRMRGLDGEKLAFGIEGLGWYQGDLRLLGSGLPALPDGVVITICSVKVILQEIGLLAEQGATYLSTTAGVDFPVPKGLRGAIVLKRARFRVSGSSEAPFFLLDGIFARLQRGETFLIEAGGYFTETTTGDTRVREFGLSGKVAFTLGTTEYGLTLDFLLGSVRSPSEEFRYLLLQAIYRSVIIGSAEIRNARLLFANNLQPKLEPADAQAGELRYYNWHRASNPLNVPGDRRLAAWRPEDDARAFGIGAGISLPSLGKLAEFNAFILGVDRPDENGALITGEVTVMSNEDPIAYFALEWDGKNDRISLVVGVDVALTKFLTDPPKWSENVGKLSGTLFVTNKPGTFAIGRLKDQRTWLTLQFDVDFFFKSFARIAFCMEQSEGGDSGMGMVISLEGGVDGGSKYQLTYLARFGWLIASFSTGSSDGAATITIEFAVRAVLFRFLRVGVSLAAELRYIGNRPSRGEALIKVRFETPWFLPDLTWTLDCTFGEADPAALATAASPLRLASAIEGPTLANVPLHLARFDPGDPAFDPDWDGSGPEPTFSIRQFSAAPASETERIARFEADTSVRPIATDATIAIDWNVAVNDQLSLGADLAGGIGTQSAGELDLTYDLVAIKVRRRKRFGADRAWRDLEERLELGADFSDPGGVQLDGEYGPQALAKFWDMDVRIAGKTAAKRLLINAATPFSFITSAPETDEETVAGNPNWPCCPPKDEDVQPYPVHVVQFRDEPPGRRITGDRIFTESASRLLFLRDAIVRPSGMNQLTPPNALIAFLATIQPGPFLRAELDEAAAFCALRIAWGRSNGLLDLVGFDADGSIVAHQQHPLGTATGFQDIVLPGSGPIHRLEARLILPPGGGPDFPIHNPRRGIAIEIDRVSYIGLRDYLDAGRRDEACQGVEGDGADAYSGAGKLFFLPNHDYEIAVTTRLTIAHPSKPPEAAGVPEYVYFRTKGLPGLNAVERVGEEIEPYVAAAYAGGRGLLYREEPVTLAFTEDFLIAVPLDQRPAGSAEEAAILQQLQLLAAPDMAATPGTVTTATSTDWIVDNRASGPGLIRPDWISVITASRFEATPMRSGNPFRSRLAKLTQRSTADCIAKDPRDVTGSVLIAQPQGAPHPLKADAEIWPAATAMTATARAKGAAYIDRRAFAALDKTAFTFATETGADNGAEWSVEDGQLHLSTGSERRFALVGETSWNHLTARVGLTFEHAAGIGLSLPQSSPNEGLFAILDRSGTGLVLVLYSRAPGGAFTELLRDTMADAPAPETPLVLTVDLFDDRLRARCLDLLVEVPRNGFREGRMALLGEGEVTFSSLQVRGRDFYAFPVRTSRYISFAEHIGSFSGTPATTAPDALGAGAASATVADLYAATRHDFSAAMQPDAPPEARQALFDRWIEGLALPIRQDVQALAITRYIEEASTALLLIESPEPIDFTSEVALELARLSPVPLDRFRPLTDVAERATNPLREALIGSARRPSPGRPPRRTPIILSVSEIKNGLRVEMNAAALARTGQVQSETVFAQRDPRNATFFKGKLPILPQLTKRITVEALRQNSVPLNGNPIVFPILQELKKLEPGMVALFSIDLSQILDVFQPPEEEEPLRLAILQDAELRRTLIVPHDGTAAQNIEPGLYNLSFTLNRQRFPTEEPANATNRYTANARVNITL